MANATKAMNWMILLSLSLLVQQAIRIHSTQDNAEADNNDRASQRRCVRLPRIFDFARFRVAFNKVYPSIKDELARKKLFLSNTLKIFAHNIAYKLKITNYYMSVTQFTDLTSDELKKMSSRSTTHDDDLTKNLISSGQRVLEHIVESRTGYESLAESIKMKLRGQKKIRRSKRSITKSDDCMINETNSTPIGIEKFDSTDSRNIDSFEANQASSFPIDENIDGNDDMKDLTVGEGINMTPFRVSANNETKQYSIGSQQMDRVYLDWRLSNCLSEPKDQKLCSCCYAMASTAIMEFANCVQSGALVLFSEQYVIDCGRHVNMEGCSGGSPERVGRFMMNWGAELYENYPFVGSLSRGCQYSADEWYKASYKRPELKLWHPVDTSRWEFYLEKFGPIYVVMTTPDDFYNYGGGIYNTRNCKKEFYNHAMVLIGHGIQDGEEYWIVRNSWGEYWGESGHIRVAKNLQSDCWFKAYVAQLDFVTPQMIGVLSPFERYFKLLVENHDQVAAYGPYLHVLEPSQ